MDGQISDLRDYLLEHLDDDWTVEKMAKKAGISSSYFPVIFRKCFKNSPAAWLKEKRLDKAKHLVETTYDHIDQIGLDVGMPTPSHFAHDFKLKYGLTPTQQRNQFHEARQATIEDGQE